MLHFGRRGRENLANLTRKHFAVQRDGEGKMYVYKVLDEQTKNHQCDSELSSDGRMYEIKGKNTMKKIVHVKKNNAEKKKKEKKIICL